MLIPCGLRPHDNPPPSPFSRRNPFHSPTPFHYYTLRVFRAVPHLHAFWLVPSSPQSSSPCKPWNVGTLL